MQLTEKTEDADINRLQKREKRADKQLSVLETDKTEIISKIENCFSINKKQFEGIQMRV